MAVGQTLSVTEVAGSVNTSDNTSRVRILWQSYQTGDSWNGYTRTAKYYVSINGGVETEYTVSYTLPKNSVETIVDITLTVTHKDDGSGSVRVRTWMDTGISAGVIALPSKICTLTTIPLASTISAAYPVTLGDTCKIVFTPKSTSYYYEFVFSIGDFKYTAAAFSADTTSSITYTAYTPPMIVAKQFPNTSSGTMTATLYTYEDSSRRVMIGQPSSATFTVTLPETAATKPSITMTLSPETPCKKFASLYLQGRSKVRATFSGEGKYGSSISSYSLQAEGKNYASPYLSDFLRGSGNVEILGKAINSRGFANTVVGSVNVIAYNSPYIAPSKGYKNVICERCTEDGTASDKGTYLHIKGTRNYTKINTNGIVNTCRVSYRYKSEVGDWSDPVTIGTDASSDEFDERLSDIVSDKTLSYAVELSIEDDTNIPATMQFNIPSEKIAFNAKEGGNGFAFGKYATRDNVLECEWDARFNGKLYSRDDEIVDVVIDQGTVSKDGADGGKITWHYRKWLGGSAECWGRAYFDSDFNTAFGALYRCTASERYYYPFEFVDVPTETITMRTTSESGGAACLGYAESAGNGMNTKAQTAEYCALRPSASTEVATVYIDYQVFGRWK